MCHPRLVGKTGSVTLNVVPLPSSPSKELLTAATNIAEHWIAYWSKATGGRSVMTVSPR